MYILRLELIDDLAIIWAGCKDSNFDVLISDVLMCRWISYC